MRKTSPNTADFPIWRIKLLYLVIYSSFGTFFIYRTLYYRRVGLDERQIGVLIALYPLVSLAAGPLWSAIADRLGIRSRLLSLTALSSIFPLLGMIWLRGFWPFFFLTFLFAFFLGPVQPLMDSIALFLLGEQRHKYSTIRAFGSLGYAPIVWLTGYLIQGRDIRWIFVGYTFLMGIGVLLASKIKVEQPPLPKGNFVKGLKALWKNQNWLLFMVAVFIAMTIQGILVGYTTLYLDTLGAPEGLIGFSGAFGSITQTLFMWTLLPRLLRRWGSETMVIMGLGLFAFRLCLISLFPLPWVIILSQGLLGLTFGATFVAAVDYAARHSPPGLAATSQAVVTGLIAGLGRSFGGMSGGILYESLGPQNAFATYGLVALFAAGIFAWLWRKQIPSPRNNPTKD
ncbi:MAG: MFS transporter [Anaerolineae bacterium]|nr:MFS transporter [Anaerolineae bacterium]